MNKKVDLKLAVKSRLLSKIKVNSPKIVSSIELKKKKKRKRKRKLEITGEIPELTEAHIKKEAKLNWRQKMRDLYPGFKKRNWANNKYRSLHPQSFI